MTTICEIYLCIYFLAISIHKKTPCLLSGMHRTAYSNALIFVSRERINRRSSLALTVMLLTKSLHAFVLGDALPDDPAVKDVERDTVVFMRPLDEVVHRCWETIKTTAATVWNGIITGKSCGSATGNTIFRRAEQLYAGCTSSRCFFWIIFTNLRWTVWRFCRLTEWHRMKRAAK